MTTNANPNILRPERSDVATEPDHQAPTSEVSDWEGRLFGALVLAAFLLYGIGSGLADRPVGIGLVVLNSIAVAVVGLIGFRLLRSQHHRTGFGYLVGRILEALLLAGGVGVVAGTNSTNADTTGYLLAMIALGIGSMPFCHVLGRGRWLPLRLAQWGVLGYAALAVGAMIELTTGEEVAVFFAIPGGLFELAFGLRLLMRGFDRGGSADYAR